VVAPSVSITTFDGDLITMEHDYFDRKAIDEQLG